MFYFTRCALPTVCGWLMMMPAAHAQTAPAPAPPAQTASAAAAQVQALLQQTIAAQKAVSALSATLVTQSTVADEATRTSTLSFQKGVGAKMNVADKTGPLAQIVSDGKTLTIYDVSAKKFVRQPLPAGQTALAAVFSASRSILPRMMSQPEGLLENFSQPGIQSALSAGTVGATPVDVLTFQLPAEAGQPHVTAALSLGQTDHLLRQFAETVVFPPGASARTLIHTETLTSLALTSSLTAGDFAFQPPAGVTKAASLDPPMYDPRLIRGARPFVFAAKDLQGRPLTLSQYRGKVVLVDFWATWCGPCVGEMPTVIAAYNKYHSRGFDIVGISLDQDKSALTSFISQKKMPWRQVFDGKGWGSAVPRQYGVAAIPFGLLLNRNGTIAAVGLRGEELPAAIKAALAK